MGQDRDLHEPAENEATAAAEADADAFAQATEAQADTKSNDGPALAALKAVVMTTAKNKRKRDTLAAALAFRVPESEVAVHTASAKHASAVASYKSVQAEFDIVKARVDVLGTALPEYAAKLAAATATLAAVRAKSEEELAPLRHAEEADAQLLANNKIEVDSLIQALDEVHMTAAEAHQDAAEPSEENLEKSWPTEDFNFLAKSSAARCTDHEKNVQNSVRACKEAAMAVEGAQRELAAIAPARDKDDDHDDDDDDDEVVEGDEQRAALEAVVKDLEHVLQEKEDAKKAASAALDAAKQELQTIQEKKRLAPRKDMPIEKLLRNELAIVDRGLAIHQEQGSVILEAAKKKASDWSREKEELSADIHRAQLQIQVAKQDVVATREVTKTLKAGEKAAKTKLKSQRIVTVEVAQTLKARENVVKQNWGLID